MRAIDTFLIVAVLALLVGHPTGASAGDRLDRIRATVEQRFGPILGSNGVQVQDGAGGTVQVRMSVAPAHDAGREPRRWSPTESRKILARLRDVLAREFPDIEFLPSSGISLEEPGSRRHRFESVRSLERATRPLEPPAAPRADNLWAAPGDPSPAPLASAGPPASVRPPVPGAPVGPLFQSSAAAVGPDPSVAPAGVGFHGEASPVPSVRPPAPVDVNALAPAREPAYPAQPGGFSKSSWAIGDRTSRGPTTPSSLYQYPRDNEALEFMVEREVGDAIRSTFKDARVRARMERPQVVRLLLEVAMNGHQGENLQNILHFTRDVTRVVFREKFNMLRIHHQSRIRVTEADDRFSYDYRFNELTPFGQKDRGDDDPVFRAIRAERAWMIDLPRAYTLGRNASSFSIGASQRRLAPGIYSNVNSSKSTAGYFTLRHGFFENLETSLTYYTYSNTVVPYAAGVFTPSNSSLSVAAFGLKYLVPYELNGLTLAVGLSQGFQPGGERKYYLPDDFERLCNLYVVGSRRIFDNILLHLAVKRTAVTQKPDSPDNAINSVGMGFEYVLAERGILMLELKHDRYDNLWLTNFGTIQDGDGLNVNAGVVFGTTLGDVEVTARKITVPTQKEFGLGISYRW